MKLCMQILLVLVLLPVSLAKADVYKHYKAAEAMASFPEGAKLHAMVTAMVDAQVGNEPAIRPVRAAFEAFYRDLLSSEEFRNAVIDMYMEQFSVEQLTFYKRLSQQPSFLEFQAAIMVVQTKTNEILRTFISERAADLDAQVAREYERIEKLQQLDSRLELLADESP